MKPIQIALASLACLAATVCADDEPTSAFPLFDVGLGVDATVDAGCLAVLYPLSVAGRVEKIERSSMDDHLAVRLKVSTVLKNETGVEVADGGSLVFHTPDFRERPPRDTDAIFVFDLYKGRIVGWNYTVGVDAETVAAAVAERRIVYHHSVTGGIAGRMDFVDVLDDRTILLGRGRLATRATDEEWKTLSDLRARHEPLRDVQEQADHPDAMGSALLVDGQGDEGWSGPALQGATRLGEAILARGRLLGPVWASQVIVVATLAARDRDLVRFDTREVLLDRKGLGFEAGVAFESRPPSVRGELQVGQEWVVLCSGRLNRAGELLRADSCHVVAVDRKADIEAALEEKEQLTDRRP